MMNLTRRFLTSAALLVSFIQPAVAQDDPIDRRVWLGDSAFDLRIDPDKLRLSEKSIFAGQAPFVKEFMDANQDQVGSYFRFDLQEHRPGSVWLWAPDSADPIAADDGFGHRLFVKGITTLASGASLLYTFDDPKAFYGSCLRGTRANDDQGCSVRIRYAFDDTLLLHITAMPPEDRVLADFEAIAIAFHNFVKCELDVTPSNSPRQMRPMHQIAPEFLTPCADDLISTRIPQGTSDSDTVVAAISF